MVNTFFRNMSLSVNNLINNKVRFFVDMTWVLELFGLLYFTTPTEPSGKQTK